VAARTLIAADAPEAVSLSAEILGGLAYLSMSIGDEDVRAKWFANPMHAEITEIVGFDPTESWGEGDSEVPELTERELETLRDLAAGSFGGRSAGRVDPSNQVEDLLAKLGVETEKEAIQYAIRAGVTWQ